jgi:hypothetical protein
LRKARATRFGRDHHFGTLQTVDDFQRAVPLRTYEDLWREYLRDQYPIFENLTWPGRVPYLALTSGTTQGATKYIPVTREMVRSNLRGSKTMIAYHLAARPDSRLFHGRMFFLGGSTDVASPPGSAALPTTSPPAARRSSASSARSSATTPTSPASMPPWPTPGTP